jgi:hypothetical protein
MIRSLLDRLGVGVLAATGLTLLAVSVAGVSGLAGRIEAAAGPASSPAPALDVRDCPRDGHRDRFDRRERPAPSTTEL